MEWYPLSVIGCLLVYKQAYRARQHPMFKKMVVKLEVSDKDKNLYRLTTATNSKLANAERATPVTDLYQASLQLESIELTLSSNDQLADLLEESKQKTKIVKEELELLTTDAAVDFGEAWKGKSVPFRFNPDRFVFFFRDRDELYFIAFAVREGVILDSKEVMRIVTGNRPIKPRRSELYGTDAVSPEAILSRARAAAELGNQSDGQQAIGEEGKPGSGINK